MKFKNQFVAAALVAAIISPRILFAAADASPEDAYKAFAAALKDKDFKKGCAQVTPDSQSMLIGQFSMLISDMHVNDQAQREAQKIFDTYGVKKWSPTMRGQNPYEVMKNLAADVKDRPACIADLSDWMEKNSSLERTAKQKFQAVGDSQLSDVKIKGDTAFGVVKIKVGNREETKGLDFKKIGDTWYLDFEHHDWLGLLSQSEG